MNHSFYESDIEQLALETLKDEHGYKILYGPDISEDAHKEREYTEVILQRRLKKAGWWLITLALPRIKKGAGGLHGK